MEQKKGKYFYVPCASGFEIYKFTDEDKIIAYDVPGEPIYADRGEAYKRVCELNGQDSDNDKQVK